CAAGDPPPRGGRGEPGARGAPPGRRTRRPLAGGRRAHQPGHRPLGARRLARRARRPGRRRGLLPARRASGADRHARAQPRQAGLARLEAQRQRRPRWAAVAGYLRVRARSRAEGATTALLSQARRSATELTTAGWVVQAADAHLVAARIALALGRPAEARAEL